MLPLWFIVLLAQQTNFEMFFLVHLPTKWKEIITCSLQILIKLFFSNYNKSPWDYVDNLLPDNISFSGTNHIQIK